MADTVTVFVEAGSRRAFAGAVDWPGWCRSGRDEAEALLALLAFGPRYAAAVARSGIALDPPADLASLFVVYRPAGGSGTDFGVPAASLPGDVAALDASELDRQATILHACWGAFDAAAGAALGLELRTGPRGGGRSLAKIEAHVRDAEEAYLTQLGARPPKSAEADPRTAVGRLREAVLDALAARARGNPVAVPTRVTRPWPPRYFVRRSAWHALDHAWEIEDRAIRPDRP